MMNSRVILSNACKEELELFFLKITKFYEKQFTKFYSLNHKVFILFLHQHVRVEELLY